MSSYRQMRRNARQARRAGMQPMMVINTGDPFPDLVITLIARLAWRYRSELAPAAIAGALAGTGAWLHAAHPGAAVPILAGCLAAACAVVALGARAGLAPLAERAYAAAVLLAGGAWLALATALGPFTAPLPLALAVGGAVLAVPWWAHRRRRARVRVERTLAAWPDIARAVGLAGSAVMSATVDVWGWRARFRLARGQTITDASRGSRLSNPASEPSGARCASTRLPTTGPTGSNCGYWTATRTPMRSPGPGRRSRR